MTLRTRLEETIRTSADCNQAALAVCRLLEDEIGLAGNGWFDDDDELLALLGWSDEDEDEGDEPEQSSDEDDEEAAGGTSRGDDWDSVAHWDRAAEAVESALTARLVVQNKKVSSANLLRELAGCKHTDLAAMLKRDASVEEIAAIRASIARRLDKPG